MFVLRVRGPRFIHWATLVKNLFDVVGRTYDGVDHVVVDGVHETVLDTGESDHSLAALGEVAQITCDVAANLNLHGGSYQVPQGRCGHWR